MHVIMYTNGYVVHKICANFINIQHLDPSTIKGYAAYRIMNNLLPEKLNLGFLNHSSNQWLTPCVCSPRVLDPNLPSTAPIGGFKKKSLRNFPSSNTEFPMDLMNYRIMYGELILRWLARKWVMFDQSTIYRLYLHSAGNKLSHMSISMYIYQHNGSMLWAYTNPTIDLPKSKGLHNSLGTILPHVDSDTMSNTTVLKRSLTSALTGHCVSPVWRHSCKPPATQTWFLRGFVGHVLPDKRWNMSWT
jgi:hypothetical protein